MNVLIIPEDFRKDQYIVSPLIKRMFQEIGKPNAKVRVCFDPLLGGIGEALKWERIQEILKRYPMVQIFLLLVDRDGNEHRRQSLDNLEQKARALPGTPVLLAENSWQELEVWALAGQDLPAEWNWQEIRAEVHSKEVYFEPLAKERNLLDEPGAGRTTMGREAATNYKRVRSRCPEDLGRLEERLMSQVTSAKG